MNIFYESAIEEMPPLGEYDPTMDEPEPTNISISKTTKHPVKLQTPALQSFELKSKHARAHRDGGRYIDNGFNVYADSNLSSAIDEFFNANKIYSLSFKCRTWTKLKNFVSKVEAASLKESFSLEDSAAVKYSHKTGCSCGCSPGFQVRKTLKSLNEFRNHSVYVKLDYDLAPIKAVLPAFESMLKAEIEAHA